MASLRILLGALSLVLVAGCATAAPDNQQAQLEEMRFDDLARFTKWTSVLARLDENATPAAPMLAETNNLRMLPVRARAQAVNNLVNSYPYIEDDLNWGQGDYWVTPDEFFARGGGDCEDFAIAKYVLLRDLGVPEDHLRVTVVYDRYLKNMHALLTVNMDDEILVLDNQIAKVQDLEMTNRYHPIFGLGRQAWWLYSEAEQV